MPNPILFVDRDGTLCEVPHDYKIDQISKIRLLKHVIPSLLALKKSSYHFLMVSNQDGLGGESYPRPGFDSSHKFILEIFASQGITFDQVLICPHYSEELCGCRKPKVRRIKELLCNLEWDKDRSAMVGDRPIAMEFAKNLGIQGIRVDSPFGPGLSWPSIVDTLIGHGT